MGTEQGGLRLVSQEQYLATVPWQRLVGSAVAAALSRNWHGAWRDTRDASRKLGGSALAAVSPVERRRQREVRRQGELARVRERLAELELWRKVAPVAPELLRVLAGELDERARGQRIAELLDVPVEQVPQVLEMRLRALTAQGARLVEVEIEAKRRRLAADEAT
ncbi:MAG: hypothetical protein ACXVGH_00500 [Mycobacteriales bacterium]